ncbi:S-layer homology domain-containing protein [Sedimentibacter saalensis]|uniref:S-layer homology domain-containing protein n=1 Tax=Sedimentibacter saalensis TaxID=130788 RepID=UPI002898C4C8|nr:S-layer homology domain-containing protein [Sedimentibacter saalensis]
MRITNRIILILIVLLMLFNTGTVFAATGSLSYEAGYEAGYDYGYDRKDNDTKLSANDAYFDKYKDSKAHRALKNKIDDYKESEFKNGFIDGYMDAYDEKGNANQEIDYPTDLGKAMGAIKGAKDYQSGKDSDWRAAIPGSTNISKMFELDKQSSSYRGTFIKEFTTAFNEGYVEAYDMAAYDPTLVTLEQSFKDGEDVGVIVGAAYGAKDFYAGKDLDFKRDLPSRNEITEQYSLNNDELDYEDGFISGFISAYEISYNEAYRKANMNDGLNKAISMIIPISGGIAVTEDKRFMVDVPSGTYYHDVNLSIITSFDVREAGYSHLIKASDSYTIQLSNSSGNIDESKSIELSFEYYGDKFKGGIYRKDGSSWLYIPTDVEDGKMSAKINPKILNSSGTTFSAFVDDNTAAFRDIRGHWAIDEIDAYVRRGVISGYSDMTFRPDSNITRAEFLTILSRVYNWNVNANPGSTTVFKDAGTFGYYSNVINYATYHNYISGYGDGNFKPGNLISYAEVEIIMNRVLYYQSLRWIDVANNMLYDKKARSNSFNSMNNKITRAEVIYMLYNITENN